MTVEDLKGGLAVSKPRLALLSREDKTFLHEGVMEVLEEVGIAFNSPKALDVLAAADVPVDRDRLSARIPRELVEASLAMVPQQVLLAGRKPEHDIRDVGIGGHYLGCKSTRRLVHDGGSFQSRLFRRGAPGTSVPPSIVLEAAERAEQLIAANQAEPLDDDVTTYIDGIIKDFSLLDAD